MRFTRGRVLIVCTALTLTGLLACAVVGESAGAYVSHYKEPFGDFMLACDFKLSPGCNRDGHDVWFKNLKVRPLK